MTVSHFETRAEPGGRLAAVRGVDVPTRHRGVMLVLLLWMWTVRMGACVLQWHLAGVATAAYAADLWMLGLLQLVAIVGMCSQSRTAMRSWVGDLLGAHL